MSIVFWIDNFALGVSSLIALALAMVVFSAEPKRTLNASFTLFTLLVAIAAIFSLALRLALWLERGNALLLAELAVLSFYLLGPVLLLFASRYIGVSTIWYDVVALVGLASISFLAIPLFSHQVVVDPAINPSGVAVVTLKPLAYVVLVFSAAFMIVSLLLFLRARRNRMERMLALSVLLLLLGYLLKGIVQIDIPVFSLTTIVGTAIMGYAVVRQQILNPLRSVASELERKVEERTRQLEKAYEEVGIRVEERTSELRREIEERKRAERALKERATRQELISRIGQATTAILEMNELLQRAVSWIGDAFHYYNVNILLVEGEFVVLRATTLPAIQDHIGFIKLRIGKEGITGWVADTGEPLLIPDISKDDRYAGVVESPAVASELAVPIKLKDQVIGVLDAQSSKLNDFVEIDLFTMQTIADQLANALENARLYGELQQELSERKRTEEVLRESEEKFRNLAEQSPNMIFINKRGRIVYANRICEQATGYTREEFYSPQFDFFALIAPEHRELISRNYTRRLAGEEVIPYEYALLTKEGRRIEAILSSKVIRYEGEDAMLGIVTDITERKRAEVLLRSLNTAAAGMERALDPDKVFRTIGDTLGNLGFSCAVFVADETLERLRLHYHCYDSKTVVMAKKLSGLEAEDFMVHVDTAEAFKRVVRERVTTLEVGSAALKGILPDSAMPLGDQILNLLKIQKAILSPLIAEGRVIGLLSVQSDDLTPEDIPAISAFAHQVAATWHKARLMQDLKKSLEELQQTQERLLQSQKLEAIGKLAGGIAHDFNNLLTAINGYTDLLIERFSSEQAVMSDLHEIQRATEQAATLTRQLLAFSRKQVLQPKVLDLNGVINGMEKMLRRLIGEDIQLVTVTAQNLGLVKADPGQVEQVILNLAVNARDAMPQGGELTIETMNIELDQSYVRHHVDSKAGPHVMLAVSDTGVGMDNETLEHLFEPFFTTKDHGKGTGLGLSTVYGIVRQSGGHISVDSELTKGTTFKVFLPQIDEVAELSSSQALAIDSCRGTETILVVEDDEAVRQMVLRVLRRIGYTVLEASDAREALRVNNEHSGPIELLLTDVVMPGGISGPELAESLLPNRENMKVLYMSGYTNSAIKNRGLLESGVAFLQKPFTPNSLGRKIREVLED